MACLSTALENSQLCVILRALLSDGNIPNILICRFLSKRTCSKSDMEYQLLFMKNYKRHCKLFHIILERRELTVCCNHQWDRMEIRNARDVLSLIFINI